MSKLGALKKRERQQANTAPLESAANSTAREVKVCGVVRERDGYRLLVARVPEDVLRRYLVSEREPDMRATALAHASDEMFAQWR